MNLEKVLIVVISALLSVLGTIVIMLINDLRAKIAKVETSVENKLHIIEDRIERYKKDISQECSNVYMRADVHSAMCAKLEQEIEQCRSNYQK